jgi:hypothetical protein
MDFTETPHAEDFLMELDALVQEYVNRGIKPKTVKRVFEIVSDNMPKKQKKKPAKKSVCTHACLECFGGPCKKEAA